MMIRSAVGFQPVWILLCLFALNAADGSSTRINGQNPNILLIMSDDQGWGDVGYNGHSVLRTPHLDRMSAEGVTFTRFYSAAAMCSPTRGSCLTGRNPYRFGITFAMKGMLEEREVTLMSLLKEEGYTAGHFGKWHVGTLSKKKDDQRRWGAYAQNPGRTRHGLCGHSGPGILAHSLLRLLRWAVSMLKETALPMSPK
jgi:arylsulfatase A-like enzyme